MMWYNCNTFAMMWYNCNKHVVSYNAFDKIMFGICTRNIDGHILLFVSTGYLYTTTLSWYWYG